MAELDDARLADIEAYARRLPIHAPDRRDIFDLLAEVRRLRQPPDDTLVSVDPDELHRHPLDGVNANDFAYWSEHQDDIIVALFHREWLMQRYAELRAAKSALVNQRSEAEMWESWAGSSRDVLDSLVRATRGQLGHDHPLIRRAEDVLANG